VSDWPATGPLKGITGKNTGHILLSTTTLMSIRPMKLRQLAESMHHESEEKLDERTGVDYGSAGLYLCGLQTVFALLCCASSSILSCWLLPPQAISAVRTLAIVTSIGLVLVRKPLRIGRVRGVTTVFNALRPAIAIYIASLVLEQLVHTCLPHNPNDEWTQGQETSGKQGRSLVLRHVLYHILSIGLIVGGFLRARAPRSESDISFLVALIALIATAVLPPTAITHSGPLCEPTKLFDAGERLLRALLFGSVYTTLIYAGAPRRNESQEVFIAVARASAASIWILVAALWFLFLAPLQAGLILFSRLNDQNESDSCYASYASSSHHAGGYSSTTDLSGSSFSSSGYEQVPLKGATTPEMGSDIENGEISDAEAVRLALATTRAITGGTGGMGAMGAMGGAGGMGGRESSLSFSFGGTATMAPSPALNLAAIAAREAREP
tara:strand:- start:3845 stop:5164 length:1320 start_codon:yes stop_codon:yes gene_type:complete